MYVELSMRKMQGARLHCCLGAIEHRSGSICGSDYGKEASVELPSHVGSHQPNLLQFPHICS